MDKIFIKTQDLTSWLAKKYFENQDIISVDDLINAFENTAIALENCQDDFDSFRENVQQNYKPMSISEQIGYDPALH